MRKTISDRKNTKIASKASDMQEYLSKISIEKDLEQKKLLAKEMAIHFTAGGEDKFIESINTAATIIDVDRICFNAVLKGEGLSSKRFN